MFLKVGLGQVAPRREFRLRLPLALCRGGRRGSNCSDWTARCPGECQCVQSESVHECVELKFSSYVCARARVLLHVQFKFALAD